MAVAAGNSGETDNAPLYPAVYAKDIQGVVAVAAVDAALARAPYSNANDYVELAAPGGNLDADVNDDGYADGVLEQTLDPDAVGSGVFNQFAYLFADGTSMATPHVAAFAALLIDQGVTDSGGGRSGTRALRDRPRAGGSRQRHRLRPDQPARDAARPRPEEVA